MPSPSNPELQEHVNASLVSVHLALVSQLSVPSSHSFIDSSVSVPYSHKATPFLYTLGLLSMCHSAILHSTTPSGAFIPLLQPRGRSCIHMPASTPSPFDHVKPPGQTSFIALVVHADLQRAFTHTSDLAFGLFPGTFPINHDCTSLNSSIFSNVIS